MKAFQQATLLGLVATPIAAETIVGVYMFHRHGDRTPKVLPPANLTDLGYREVFLSGEYYRNRYLSPSSSKQILNISPDVVNQLQIAASAPVDTVLQNSAQGFLQSLYPPVGHRLSTQTLANGSAIPAPMDGYQLIPVNVVESGAGSENSGWLQDSTSCALAEVSSNEYFQTPQYMQLQKSTMNLYQSILPTLKPVFNSSTSSYLNAYEIYDYLNVARIHNASASDHVSKADFNKLHYLANIHEYNLAYNASSTIRAIAGKQLAAEIVDYLAGVIDTQGESKFGVQFGSYGTFFSLFGLAQLPKASTAFTGIVNYASAMTFELYTKEHFTTFPSADQLRVRFLFHNGTTTTESPPQVYPLFGGSAMSVSWREFKMRMGEFSIGNTAEWCHACGNTTGTCLPYASHAHSHSYNSNGGSSSSSSGGLSNAVCGVIGAMVTLAVILLIELVIFLAGGFTIVSKKRMRAGRAVANGASNGTKA